MNTPRILICGALGRMGTRIMQLAVADKDVSLAGGIGRKGFPAADVPPAFAGKISDDIVKAIAAADVVIDFTSPQATLEHLAVCEKNRKAIVIGTTGFDAAGREKINAAAAVIPIVSSPNMSIGVNLLFRLAAEAARAVPGYDIEIVELHHNQKKDAPSGTAVKLSEVVAEALHRDMKDVGVYGRHGVPGARTREEIGVHAVRAGDIVGEHTVYFAGPGERIELTHRAHSRDTLATGALAAAKWLAAQKPGLYDMQDVLGLKK